jgi:branched-chain amino acid transport system ATP-binding protein
MSSALETVQLCKSFGGLVVADAIDFRIDVGARHALIGPNGAGKTTFVNLVSGALAPGSGRIMLADKDITVLRQDQRVKHGLVRTFQINALFRRLSVLENVTLAIAEREGFAGDFIRPAGRYRAAIDEAYALLETLGLAPEAMKPITDLAYGRQRITEIAVALGLKPKVLLLDEPAAGVPTGEVGIIIEVIERLPADIAVLLIEHDMDLVFSFADRISVLVNGSLFVDGAPEDVARDPRVKAVYLGEEADA